jgi:hypothetical protein
MVPITETMQYISQLFTADISELFRHCLTTTYFQWQNEFYEQTDGVAMGSPLSPVIANFFMEKFEQEVLNTAVHRPTCWFRYVDDTFVIWSHGEQELDFFLDHLNSRNPKIQFTMEKEKQKQLAFLDVLVTRKPCGRLGHTVYRKSTHTDRYLNKESNHHPQQKRGVIKTLTNRAIRICEPELLPKELNHLERALQGNGYTRTEIRQATKPKTSQSMESEKPGYEGRVFLPYVQHVTDRIGKILRKHKIDTVYKPTKTLSQHLRSVKDPRDPLSTPGVYRIPCSCGSVYVGMTKRSVNTRLSEHKRSCRLGQVEKSAVAEHTLEQEGHRIRFEDTQVIARESKYYPRIYREAIEIHKHSDNFNKKDETLNLSKTWIPALNRTNILPAKQRNSCDWPNDAQAPPTPMDRIRTEVRPESSTVDSEQPRRTLRPLPHRTT